MIDLSEKLGLSGEGREKQDIEYEVDERYDEGGVEGCTKDQSLIIQNFLEDEERTADRLA